MGHACAPKVVGFGIRKILPINMRFMASDHRQTRGSSLSCVEQRMGSSTTGTQYQEVCDILESQAS
eukprot:1160396-Pelagomonas_calceolata.AAC.19